MGVQRFDTIGITQFVLYVPLTLVACFALLKSYDVVLYLKEIIGYSPVYASYYIILLITILLIFVSVLMYIIGLHNLQSTYILGQRIQDECKHTYSLYNTGNYQLYLSITDPTSPKPINTMNISCGLLYLVIGLIFGSILINNIFICNKYPDLYWTKIFLYSYPCLGIWIIAAAIYTLYKISSQPSYLYSNSISLSFSIIYAIVFVCYIYTYFKFKTDIEPYSILLMCVSILAMILIYFTQNNKVTNIINKDYFNLTHIEGKNPNANSETIGYDIQKIALQDAEDSGIHDFPKTFSKYKDLPNPPNTPFTKYIMENIKATPKWTKTRVPDNELLWPYAISDDNGKELENLYIGGSPTQQSNILQLRKDMNILRQFHEPGDILSSFAFKANTLILALIVVVVYPLFNMMYRNNPILITYAVSIILIFVFCEI